MTDLAVTAALPLAPERVCPVTVPLPVAESVQSAGVASVPVWPLVVTCLARVSVALGV